MGSWEYSSQKKTAIVLLYLLSTSIWVGHSTRPDDLIPLKDKIKQIIEGSVGQAAAALANVTNAVRVSMEERAFLIAHNKARLHAQEPMLKWDPQLANYARNYCQKRAADCALIHSNGPYGENLFWGGAGAEWDPVEIVSKWIKEHKFYNKGNMACRDGRMCGHYTQVVWHDSRKLGCATCDCNNGDTFAVCSYDPPGNYVGENPFQAHAEKL